MDERINISNAKYVENPLQSASANAYTDLESYQSKACAVNCRQSFTGANESPRGITGAQLRCHDVLPPNDAFQHQDAGKFRGELYRLGSHPWTSRGRMGGLICAPSLHRNARRGHSKVLLQRQNEVVAVCAKGTPVNTWRRFGRSNAYAQIRISARICAVNPWRDGDKHGYVMSIQKSGVENK